MLVEIAMKWNFIFRLFILSHGLFLVVQAQETLIPQNRRIKWNPGIAGDIPVYSVSVNVKDYGAKGDGAADDTEAFKNAIEAASEGEAVFIPEGDYRITRNLRIYKGIALRGEGYQKSRLLFDQPDGGSCIEILTYQRSAWSALIDTPKRGEVSFSVNHPEYFRIGDYVELKQDNDPEVFSPGAAGHFDDEMIGQLLRVTAISGNTLYFDREIYFNYNAAMNPRARRHGMVESAGVEDLTIKRLFKAKSGSNIVLRHCSNCWVKGVYSDMTITAHIYLVTACRNEIVNNYFYDSFDHGEGGKGYGIRCEARATDNLIENNIFNHLRHSMVVMLGACGNVFGYNYSKDPFYKSGNNVLFPDISVHGHYPYFNLFEGNTVQFLLVDNVWGTNGPNTFFRNRIEKDVAHYLKGSEKYGFIEVKQNNPNQNFIGNELGVTHVRSENPLVIHAEIENSTLLHGNYIVESNTYQWDENISEREIPASCYLNEKPDWLTGTTWPCFGGPQLVDNLIPAKKRFLSGEYITGFSDTFAPKKPVQLQIQ